MLKDGRGLEQNFPQWYSHVGAAVVVVHLVDEVVDDMVTRVVVGHIEVMLCVDLDVEVEVDVDEELGLNVDV